MMIVGVVIGNWLLPNPPTNNQKEWIMDGQYEQAGRFPLFASLEKTDIVLSRIFAATDASHLRRIAENRSITPYILEELSKHPDATVREAVSDNPHTPIDTLLMLTMDESIDVRYAMAENHNLPAALLIALSNDENGYVACRALDTLKVLELASSISPYWNDVAYSGKRLSVINIGLSNKVRPVA